MDADDLPRIDDDPDYEPVFRNCNVCGRPLIFMVEAEMGMCLTCADE